MRRPLQFLAFTFAFSWIPMLVLIMIGADVSHGPAQLVFGIAASGPTIVAGLLWLCRPKERRPMRRPRLWAIVVAVLVGSAIPVLPALIAHASDPGLVAGSAAKTVAGVGGVLGFVGLTLITGPLAEEFGWRGYLQPRLRRRLSVPRTVAVIGPIWSLWHLPLFFLRGTGQYLSGLLSVRGLSLLIGLIPFSFVLLTLVERLRGGVVAAIAAHFGFNGADALMPDPSRPAMIGQAVVLVVLACAAALVWRRSDQGPSQPET